MAQSWLNTKLLERALKSYRMDDTTRVLNFQPNKGFSEHFSSQMFSCEVVFESSKCSMETLNIVIKAYPAESDVIAPIVAESPIFQTEILMYLQTLPAIRELFVRNGMECDFLAPELIYATEDPFPLLILRDMRLEGYATHRSPPDCLEDTKLIIRGLAQLHAASFYLAENNEFDFSSFSYNYYENELLVEAYFIDSVKAFKEVVASWEGYESFVPKIEYLINNICEIGKRSFVRNRPGSGYNVLNHGDFHLRNILLKFNAETSRLDGFRLIDYQICNFCSPALDVNYFMAITKFDEANEFHHDELIIFYHDEFAKAVKQFGYLKSPPSLLDLNVELLRHGEFAMVQNIVFIPFLFMDPDAVNAEDYIAADKRDESLKLKIKLMQQPSCEKLLKRALKSWVAKGYL